jgi:two-component sensor histidine kinase
MFPPPTGEALFAKHKLMRRAVVQSKLRCEGFQRPTEAEIWGRDCLYMANSSDRPASARGKSSPSGDDGRGVAELRKELAQAAAELKLKDSVLQDIEHRTKNVLQTAVALLDLQARRADAPAVREALSTASRRMVAMAAAHELLNSAQGDSGVPIGRYLSELCRSHADSARGVEVRFECDVDLCPPQIAIPLGLLISEAVMNSLKHGFPEARGGVVGVRLGSGDAGGMELTIADNGVGCDVSSLKGGGLGGAIIERFARQLKGELSVASSAGTGYTLQMRFPRWSGSGSDGLLGENDPRLA